jgi:hypothetical protein
MIFSEGFSEWMPAPGIHFVSPILLWVSPENNSIRTRGLATGGTTRQFVNAIVYGKFMSFRHETCLERRASGNRL